MPNPPNFTVTTDLLGKVNDTIRELARTKVMVGVPADTDQKYSATGTAAGTVKRNPPDKINNATIGYIHEHGSPVNNIPPRPWLTPGVKAVQEKITSYLKQAGEKAFAGNAKSMMKALHAAGMTAQSSVKNRITAGIPPPLKPATVAARQRRVKSRKASTPADVTPLIDSAQFLNSISYTIKKGRK